MKGDDAQPLEAPPPLPVSANGRQVGGNHYKIIKIEPWDYAAANALDFFQGSVVKYVTRFRDKAGVEDLKKAQHYLQKMIEIEESYIDSEN